MSQQQETQPKVRELPTFGQVVAALCDGDAEREATEAFNRLLTVLREDAEHNGDSTGDLTLKLRIKVDNKGVVGIGHALTVKEPTPGRGSSVFWVSPSGRLTPENPRQQKMNFRDVNATKETPKDIPAETAKAKSV